MVHVLVYPFFYNVFQTDRVFLYMYSQFTVGCSVYHPSPIGLGTKILPTKGRGNRNIWKIKISCKLAEPGFVPGPLVWWVNSHSAQGNDVTCAVVSYVCHCLILIFKKEYCVGLQLMIYCIVIVNKFKKSPLSSPSNPKQNNMVSISSKILI